MQVQRKAETGTRIATNVTATPMNSAGAYPPDAILSKCFAPACTHSSA
jgi:hypothetical protein